jgi:hypothetical protein
VFKLRKLFHFLKKTTKQLCHFLATKKQHDSLAHAQLASKNHKKTPFYCS